MSADARSRSEHSKVVEKLADWLAKANALTQARTVEETQAESVATPQRERLAQLNFKIPKSRMLHIKQLAVRDDITLLTMLDRMVALYEEKYGKLR